MWRLDLVVSEKQTVGGSVSLLPSLQRLVPGLQLICPVDSSPRQTIISCGPCVLCVVCVVCIYAHTCTHVYVPAKRSVCRRPPPIHRGRRHYSEARGVGSFGERHTHWGAPCNMAFVCVSMYVHVSTCACFHVGVCTCMKEGCSRRSTGWWWWCAEANNQLQSKHCVHMMILDLL